MSLAAPPSLILNRAALLALPLSAVTVAVAAPPPGQSALLNGMHDPESVSWMASATPGPDKGWITDLRYIGSSGPPGAECHAAARAAGLSIIQRLDLSGDKSFPADAGQRAGYADAFAAYAAACPDLHVWIVGNEPNFTVGKSDPDCSSEAYAATYVEVHKRLHALPGHSADLLLCAPNSPYSPGCLHSLRDIIRRIKQGGVTPDGFALHAYTRAASADQLAAALVSSTATQHDVTVDECPGGATWDDTWFSHFRIYKDYVRVIEAEGLAGKPIFITESGNACDPNPGNACYPDADIGYFQAIYADAAAHNCSGSNTKIRAITPYRWTSNDDGTGRDFAIGKRPALLADLKKAFAAGHSWMATCPGQKGDPPSSALDGRPSEGDQATVDLGGAAGRGPRSALDGGCGCQLGGASAGGAGPALLLLFVVLGRRRRAVLLAGGGLLLAIATAGCPGNSNVHFPDRGGGEAGLAEGGARRDLPTVYACDTVDLLFVIDNSLTMFQEQENLAANFPKLVQRLAAIQPPIKSLHLGVVSTDLGAGPYTTGVGNCKPGGDDGKLQHTPHGADCAPSYPKYLEGAPSASLARDFGCIAQLGTTGCGYEQQLESALRALTAQPENDGFLRRDAPLAIVFVSDEDDCSAQDPTIFDPDDPGQGELPTRCVRLTEKLHPVSRYVTGFRALKDNPQRLAVVAITGPPGAVQLDPSLPTGVKPICTSQSFGEATPGNRFADLVKAFGERGAQSSLCEGDLSTGLDIVGKAVERACLE